MSRNPTGASLEATVFLIRSPDGTPGLVFSATDLVTAGECEYRVLRVLDEKLGRTPPARFPADEMRRRAAELGDVHERKVLASLIDRFGEWDRASGTGVYEVSRGSTEPTDLAAKHAETVDALRNGADAVFQATFFDGEFLGYADFLVREGADGAPHDGGPPDGGRPQANCYAVWDTKLARHAKVGALLQLAAYGDQLLAAGIRAAPRVTLVLGDLNESTFSLADLLPVYRERRNRFRALTRHHLEGSVPVAWGQADITACGRCDYCSEQAALHRDLLLVNGMSAVRRRKLWADGITTIDQLAELPAEKAAGPLARLRDQARMQTGRGPVDGQRTYRAPDGQKHTVAYKLLPDHILAQLPAPSPGDIFFDFEGDPLWQDPATGSWGLEYLFGAVEAPDGDNAATPEMFHPFWAHSRAEERQAFLEFLAYVEERRERHPDMHVYHYAPYEKSALRNLSVRHVAGEDVVDRWLREGLLVDLLAVVRHSVRISSDSYSIKKLEPLYMGEHLRTGDVTDAGASVVAYAAFCAARDAGNVPEAESILASISAYNHYDCLSTLRLRDWLLQLGQHAGERSGERRGGGYDGGITGVDDGTAGTQAPGGPHAPGGIVPDPPPAPGRPARGVPPGPPASEPEPDAVETVLTAHAAALLRDSDREISADGQAVAMIAAATGYHRREDKQFWWGHFDRLEQAVDAWPEARNVFVVHDAEVLADWAAPGPRARTQSRTVRLRGTATEGSDFRPGSTWFRAFAPPHPEGLAEEQDEAGTRIHAGLFHTTVSDVAEDPDEPGTLVLTIVEKSTQQIQPYPELPMALTPNTPVPTGGIRKALAALAATVADGLPALPPHPGVDLLRRIPPRLDGGCGLPAVGLGENGGHDYVAAITAAVRRLDHSYLAVQGPPGTGKTHVGSHVIARLVAEGWKIGVVGQSHAVVENMLRAAIAAGVDRERVAKKPKEPAPVPWAGTDDDALARLLADAPGALLGGTAWTLTGKAVPPGSLDLLVIDEAGQFSLANTLAVAQAAPRLLLLGDPQQLPQVTQGTHPEPVDRSALGWISAGQATLPAELGYFLADSWRLHPDLCAAVSRLSYDGKLFSAPAAGLRQLHGKRAGVETVLVKHTGNRTSSVEEAAEVVAQVRAHLGLAWIPEGAVPARPLAQADVLVVAAYNAQVSAVRRALDAAGFPEVRVGTVDRFQGQQAVVVLITMACSSVAEAPRGSEFLLNRNRLNVAVSRAQWRAVIIRSRQLADILPGKPELLAELGAFIGLCSGT